MPERSPSRPWTWRELGAVPRALVELARARAVLPIIDPAAIAALNARHDAAASSGTEGDLVRIVARVIPATASLVPWRADCLVQAIAAQRWLASEAIGGTIVLGIDRNRAGIEPHAWLRVGDIIVTGGQIDRYTVLLDGTGQGGPET